MFLRYAFLLFPLVDAWTFRYTNETSDTEIIRGADERNCTVANIAEEKLFTWDPEGTDQCVSIYRDTKCDSRGGYSCASWRKNASRTFMAFDIMPENLILAKAETSTLASTSTSTSTSTSSSSAASTATTSSTSVAAFTPTSTPSNAAAATNTDSGSSSSLSGGAIAGVVIGVIAAVAIVVGLVVFFMKRRSKTIAPTSHPSAGYGPHEADATGSSMSGTTAKEPLASVGFRPVPGSRFVELKGDEGITELGSSPISELDGGSGGQRRL